MVCLGRLCRVTVSPGISMVGTSQGNVPPSNIWVSNWDNTFIVLAKILHDSHLQLRVRFFLLGPHLEPKASDIFSRNAMLDDAGLANSRSAGSSPPIAGKAVAVKPAVLFPGFWLPGIPQISWSLCVFVSQSFLIFMNSYAISLSGWDHFNNI